MDGVERKCGPSWVDPVHALGIRSARGAVADHGVVLPAAFPELVDGLHIVVGDGVAFVMPGLLGRPMALAALSRKPVTMFQPIRPLVRWSSVDMRRAKDRAARRTACR